MPPSPTSAIGPNRASWRAPTISSTPSPSGAIALDRELGRRQPLVHVAGGRLQLLAVGDADPHAARVRLVQRAQRLEHDREAELESGGHRRLHADRPPRVDERHAGRREQIARAEVAVVQIAAASAQATTARPVGGGRSTIAAVRQAAASIVA